ncbi:MAG: aminodeoxychorismate synthase component I [Kordiimonadaceae bacterium]|nr:aminodeoxychorismate synthase component I [Kordiimonadaceae bacterium]
MKNSNLTSVPFVLLDDSREARKACNSYLFQNPEFIIKATEFDQIEKALNAIDVAIESGLHVAGWISYECARAFEPKLKACITRQADEPLIWMMATKRRETLTGLDVQALLAGNEDAPTGPALHMGQPTQNREAYSESLKHIQAYIDAGDVYQINHTLPIPVETEGTSLGLYRQLRANQPVAYGAYIETGQESILSLSPELFIQKLGDKLTTKPMKGTAPRGRTTGEDQQQQQMLRNDAKSQAENLMIVDLIRNDLTRIAKSGSVAVPKLFDVEQFSTLHQMTSTVTADARPSLQPSSLLKAMFPCGSVTGAPKIRAMEIIQSLETSPRGVYCGAIGFFSPKTATEPENWCLNVPIRTVVLKQRKTGGYGGRLHVGSGVVADSHPEDEYDECLLKAAFAKKESPDFSLIETMRVEDGRLNNQSNHMARLADSAIYFDIPCAPAKIENSLNAFVATLPATQRIHKVRLLLDKAGHVRLSSTEIEASSEIQATGPLTVCLSAMRTNSTNAFLFHKTTNRALYDAAFAKAQSLGHADMLFMNEKGQLTEGAISTLYVEMQGILYTPPIHVGLLAGTHRADLLTSRTDIQVRTISYEELKAADALYIGNAVRGLRKVILVSEAIQI